MEKLPSKGTKKIIFENITLEGSRDSSAELLYIGPELLRI